MSEALPKRQLISVSIDAFEPILEPMYTKSLAFSMYLSFLLTVDGIYVPWLSILFFLKTDGDVKL